MKFFRITTAIALATSLAVADIVQDTMPTSAEVAPSADAVAMSSVPQPEPSHELPQPESKPVVNRDPTATSISTLDSSLVAESPDNTQEEVIIDGHQGVQLWKNGPYWATCNIGASAPEESGYYFWWGDTIGYKLQETRWIASDGSNENFSFSSGNSNIYTAGKSRDDLLMFDWIRARGSLKCDKDAASAHWGSKWIIPEEQDLINLSLKCSYKRGTYEGVPGAFFTGCGEYSDKSIFLPAAGLAQDQRLINQQILGNYWSSTKNAKESGMAMYLRTTIWDCEIKKGFCMGGHPIRAISYAAPEHRDTTTNEVPKNDSENLDRDIASLFGVSVDDLIFFGESRSISIDNGMIVIDSSKSVGNGCSVGFEVMTRGPGRFTIECNAGSLGSVELDCVKQSQNTEDGWAKYDITITDNKPHFWRLSALNVAKRSSIYQLVLFRNVRWEKVSNKAN